MKKTRSRVKKKNRRLKKCLLKSSNLRQMKPKDFANVSDFITQNEEISGVLNRFISNIRFINISWQGTQHSSFNASS